jgi:hypothetical protein
MLLRQSPPRKMHAHRWLLGVTAYGLVNAALYSSLLPLWEGFDEAFHYGYVQELSTRRSLPALGRSMLSDEIDASLRIAPLSFVVQRTIPEATTFSGFFALTAQDRAERRAHLFALAPALRLTASPRGNYEAHQAPLAYALLAIPDRLWSSQPLPVRVWRLRLLASCVSVVLVAASCVCLAAALSLGGLGTAALAFFVFSTQT